MTADQRYKKGLAAQPEPKLITAFACNQCGKPHLTFDDARKCCACHTCGTPFEHTDDRQFDCGHCQRPGRVRYLKESIEREEARIRSIENEIAEARKKLKHFFVIKRPPKGSSPEK